MLPKAIVANMAEVAGDGKLARLIRATMRPPHSPVTTLPASVAAALRLPGRLSAMMHVLGEAIAPFWLSYGLYMAQVEAACLGHCIGCRGYNASVGIWLPINVNALLDEALRLVRQLGRPLPPRDREGGGLEPGGY